jgi:glycosyltransferase involved in cell wall biosynthesis
VTAPSVSHHKRDRAQWERGPKGEGQEGGGTTGVPPPGSSARRPLKEQAGRADLEPVTSALATLPTPEVGTSRRVAFVVPAYNEARTIGEVLERVAALPLDVQLIVVDDGSTDGTAAIVERFAERHPATTILRQRNQGKGAAIRAALPYVTAGVVVIQDADLEYDPADVPALVEPVLAGVADVVYGSRLTGGKPQRVHMFWHLVGNRCLTLLTNLLFNTTLSDMETGYKVFRSDVLRELHLRQDGFGIEPEITGEVCRRRLRVYELPIAYYGRSYAEGKKITWRDGVTAIGVLLSVRLRG